MSGARPTSASTCASSRPPIRDLEHKARDGTFREDLFYRLDVLPVKLPPLRDRADDIPVLVRFFVDGFNREFRKRVESVDPPAIEALQRHAWPGNVRELRNVVERAVLLSEGSRLTERDFPMLRPRDGLPTGVTLPPAGTNLEAIERDPRRTGPGTNRLEPDPRRHAARTQSGPDPLSDREVRVDEVDSVR